MREGLSMEEGLSMGTVLIDNLWVKGRFKKYVRGCQSEPSPLTTLPPLTTIDARIQDER